MKLIPLFTCQNKRIKYIITVVTNTFTALNIPTLSIYFKLEILCLF